MWWDHPFSQISKITERAVGVGVGSNREEGSWTKFEKGGVCNIGGWVFIK